MFDVPAPPWKPTPVVHVSPATPRAAPLDLASAALGQDGTKLKLVIRTRGVYDPAELTTRGRRVLCLDLAYGQPRQKAELCVRRFRGRLVLSRVASTPVAGTVTLKGTRLTAKFTPVDAELPFGAFRWSVRSRWGDGSDALPRRGTFAARARLLAEPRCFGAAAQARCSNPALTTVASPTPSEALLIPGAPCTVMDATPMLAPCHFGVAPGEARESVALIGDSHAEHWRAALDVVAQAKRWRVVAMTRGGCPLTDTPVSHFPPPQAAECQSFNAAARAWLFDHPEVHTVFVSANDMSQFAGDAVAGYRSAWQSLPASVRTIYVLRDTPSRVSLETSTCVERLLRARRAIGSRCAEPRAGALPPDPQVEAARAPGDDRVRLLDLSDRMCTATLCPPVVGGALVLRDLDHLTRTFSTTLGPYLLRALA
ncbi:SGNH hydrolase domain-containing protein [Solirubrobacter soli]|uniref:SGNH hydrolase domain-containing protein n=1 Tax=Solirubrobacter soli TaxID=363832 RepID=UPI000428A9B0|nr:SGNH hydrolase domain-containing protein [Solirubrobacter soli]